LFFPYLKRYQPVTGTKSRPLLVKPTCECDSRLLLDDTARHANFRRPK
jgi:hypothetical protein